MASEEKPDSVLETIKTVVYAVLLALFIRSVAFEPFNIPSGSMLPNLLVGDYLFISKYSYGYSRFSFPMGIVPLSGRWWPGGEAGGPKLGDIVVFALPRDPGTDYIKRVIGLPGDRIQVVGGILRINGKSVTRRYLSTYVAEGAEGVPQTLDMYMETLPNGVEHRILELSDDEPLDNTPVYTVPADHYFLMGDNRDNSQDSRVPQAVGFVPAENILGPARFFFFSVDAEFRFFQPWTWPGHIRWARMFRSAS